MCAGGQEARPPKKGGGGGDRATHNIPDAVERTHDSNKEDDESQRDSVGDEPAGDEEADSEENGEDGKPVLLAPPKGKEEANGEDETSDLTSDDVKAAEGQQGADERGAQVAGGQRDQVLAADHVGDAALAWVERDGLHTASSADGGEGMTELMECDDQHLKKLVVSLGCGLDY